MADTHLRVVDAAWLAAINLLGFGLTFAQLPLVALVALNSGSTPAVSNAFLRKATQLMWDAHDWLEHAELHPPSIWS